MPTDSLTPASGPRPGSGAWTLRRAFLAAVGVSLLVSFTGVFDHAVWTPDEPRVAEIGREMLVNGDYVVPTLSNEAFLEKPPLCWWVMAGLYRVFGVSDGVARSTSAIAAVLTLLLVFDATRRVTSPLGGLMATVAAGTMSGFYFPYHRALVDPWLSLFVMLGYWAFVAAEFGQGEERRGPPPAWAVLVIWVAGGLGFLTKGPVGPALLAGPLIVALVVRRRWSFFRTWAHVPGALAFLGLCALWPTLLHLHDARHGTEFFHQFMVGSLLHRFVPPEEGAGTGHVQPFWYYFASFPSDSLPWLVAFPALVHWLWRKRVPEGWSRPALVFLAAVFPIGLLMLSAAGTKRGLYLLPVTAPLGAAVGAWLAATARKDRVQKIDRWTQIILLAVAALAVLAVTAVAAVLYLGGGESWLAREGLVMRGKPSAPLFPLLLGASALLAVGLTVRGVRLWRRGSERMSLHLALSVLVFIVLGGTIVFQTGDGFKSLHYMTDDLKRLDALSPSFAGNRLDEVTVGIIPFYLGIVPRELDTEELESYVAEHPLGKIMFIERRMDRVPPGVLARLRLIERWPYSKHRVYCLYEIGPAEDKPKPP